MRAYDTWVLSDLNNAKLGSIATYTRRVPQFRALLDTCNGELRCFYQKVSELAARPMEERNRRLDQRSPESLED